MAFHHFTIFKNPFSRFHNFKNGLSRFTEKPFHPLLVPWDPITLSRRQGEKAKFAVGPEFDPGSRHHILWISGTKMNPRRHTYLAQRILWSARQFLQVETPPLHLGGVEACDFPKCGKLGSIICESWGLRSRSPLIPNLIFASSLCSSLPHLYIAVKSKNNQFILPSNFSCSSDQPFFFIFCHTFIFEPIFQNKQSNNSFSFHCW